MTAGPRTQDMSLSRDHVLNSFPSKSWNRRLIQERRGPGESFSRTPSPNLTTAFLIFARSVCAVVLCRRHPVFSQVSLHRETSELGTRKEECRPFDARGSDHEHGSARKRMEGSSFSARAVSPVFPGQDCPESFSHDQSLSGWVAHTFCDQISLGSPPPLTLFFILNQIAINRQRGKKLGRINPLRTGIFLSLEHSTALGQVQATRSSVELWHIQPWHSFADRGTLSSRKAPGEEVRIARDTP